MTRVYQSLLENAYSNQEFTFCRINPFLRQKETTCNLDKRCFYVIARSCLLYCVIWPYATFIAYALQALQYTYYQDVSGTLDVDKWTFEKEQSANEPEPCQNGFKTS